MIKTRLTELLGIQHPILMGAMHRLTTAEMVAAVAEAGGLGFIPAASFASAEEVREEIRRAKVFTDKPIGLNISLVPAVHPGAEKIRAMVRVGIEERVAAFETAGASPAGLIEQIKEARIPLLHKVTQVHYAKKAEALGADAVIVVGFEGGGYIGPAEIATMTLVNGAARAVSIPVVAAGGIVDGNGLIAALALGAEGVLMGTRFIAATESRLPPNFLKWMLETGEGGTLVLLRSLNNPLRFIRNRFTETLATLERGGHPMQDLVSVMKQAQETDIRLDNDTENRLFPVGLGVSLIDGIKPTAEIIRDIVRDAEAAMKRLDRMRGL